MRSSQTASTSTFKANFKPNPDPLHISAACGSPHLQSHCSVWWSSMVRNLTISRNRPPLHAFNSSSRSDLHFIWFISFQFSPTPRNHKRVRKVCSSSNHIWCKLTLWNPLKIIMTWVGINSTHGVRAYFYFCFSKYRILVKLGNTSIQLWNEILSNKFTQKIMTRYIILVNPIRLPSCS